MALLATLVLLFGFQGEQILAQPLIIAILAVPILIQVYFNSGLAYLLNRATGEAHCVAGPCAVMGWTMEKVIAIVGEKFAEGKHRKAYLQHGQF